MKCPQCGSADLRRRPRRGGLYPAGCVAVLGLPLAILHRASAPTAFHCEACGADFARRTTWARIALAAMIVLIATVLLLVILVSTRHLSTALFVFRP